MSEALNKFTNVNDDGKFMQPIMPLRILSESVAKYSLIRLAFIVDASTNKFILKDFETQLPRSRLHLVPMYM